MLLPGRYAVKRFNSCCQKVTSVILKIVNSTDRETRTKIDLNPTSPTLGRKSDFSKKFGLVLDVSRLLMDRGRALESKNAM